MGPYLEGRNRVGIYGHMISMSAPTYGDAGAGDVAQNILCWLGNVPGLVLVGSGIWISIQLDS